jgi:hypothetical protein
VLAEPFGQRLGELPPRTVVGQDPVPARPFHGGGQGPGAAHLDLELPREPLRLLLEPVEVLAEQGRRSAVVDARGIGEPPARRLQVCPEPGQQPHGAAGQVGMRPAARDLRQVGQLRHLPQHGPHRLVERVLVLAGVRPDAGGHGHRDGTPARAVAEIVQEPTTRVPS